MSTSDESENSTTSQRETLVEQEIAWAHEVVRLNDGPGNESDKRAQLLAFIEKENYQLSSRELYATSVLLNQSKSETSLRKTQTVPTPFEIDHEESLREQTESFANEFFRLDMETRQRRFEALIGQVPKGSQVEKRLSRLQPALNIDLSNNQPDDPIQKRLAEYIGELFVAPIQKRGSLRQSFLQPIWQSNQRFKFVKAAQDLKKFAPELANLEMEFIEQLANNESHQRTAERNQNKLEKRYASLPSESPLEAERTNLIYVFVAVSIVGGLIAGLSRESSKPRNATNNYTLTNTIPDGNRFTGFINEMNPDDVKKLTEDLAMRALINRAKAEGDIEVVQQITLKRAFTMVNDAEEIIARHDHNVKDDGSFVDGPNFSPTIQEKYTTAFELIEGVLPSFPENVFCLNCKEYFTRACFGHAITLRQNSGDLQERERVIRLGIEAGLRVVKLDKPEYRYLHGHLGSLWHLLSELQAQRGEQAFEISSLMHAISHQRIAARNAPLNAIHKARLDGHLRAFSLALVQSNRPEEAIAVSLERRHLFPNDVKRLIEIAKALGSTAAMLGDERVASGMDMEVERLTVEIVIEAIDAGLKTLEPVLGDDGITSLKDDAEWNALLQDVLAESLKNQLHPTARRLFKGATP